MPADYVNKLARMFQDIKVSDDLNMQFKEHMRGGSKGGAAGEGQAGELWDAKHNSLSTQYKIGKYALFVNCLTVYSNLT